MSSTHPRSLKVVDHNEKIAILQNRQPTAAAMLRALVIAIVLAQNSPDSFGCGVREMT